MQDLEHYLAWYPIDEQSRMQKARLPKDVTMIWPVSGTFSRCDYDLTGLSETDYKDPSDTAQATCMQLELRG